MYSNTFQKYSYLYSNTLVNDVFIFVFMNFESIRIRIPFKVFAPGLVLTGHKHDLTACTFVKNGVTGGIYDW